MADPARIALGRAIRFARQRRGWTQDQLAGISGLHRTYIGGVERGTRNPNYETLRVLAGALEISLADLMAEAQREQERIEARHRRGQAEG